MRVFWNSKIEKEIYDGGELKVFGDFVFSPLNLPKLDLQLLEMGNEEKEEEKIIKTKQKNLFYFFIMSTLSFFICLFLLWLFANSTFFYFLSIQIYGVWVHIEKVYCG